MLLLSALVSRLRVGPADRRRRRPARAPRGDPLRRRHLRVSQREPKQESRQARPLCQLLLRHGARGHAVPSLRPLRPAAPEALGSVRGARRAVVSHSPWATRSRRRARRDPRLRLAPRVSRAEERAVKAGLGSAFWTLGALDELARRVPDARRPAGAGGAGDAGRARRRPARAVPRDELPDVGAERTVLVLRLPDVADRARSSSWSTIRTIRPRRASSSTTARSAASSPRGSTTRPGPIRAFRMYYQPLL